MLGFGGITVNWREAVRQRREAERQKALLLVSERKAIGQAATAEAAEKRARAQADKADAINRFLIDKLLNQAEPGTNPNARSVTLLETLDRAAADASAVTLCRQLVARDTGPSNRLARRERIDRVRAALAALPPRDREVLVMRHFERLETAEIAEALGLTEGDVLSRLFRALDRMRSALEVDA